MEKYDVVIIGAGVSGLICGSYLAKSKYRVLIVEQQQEVGGYCKTFFRKKYKFCVGPHYLAGIQRGVLGKILRELDVLGDLNFYQNDPTDKVIFQNQQILIRANYQETIKELKRNFFHSKNEISNFFEFITQKHIVDIYSKVKKISFIDLLNSYITDTTLKQFLSGLLNGILGVEVTNISAWIGIEVIRDFFLDPGYCLPDGIDYFPKILSEQIKSHSGEIILKQQVKKISISGDQVNGVITDDGKLFRCDKVVVTADPFQLSKILLPSVPFNLNDCIFSPTPSALVLYLGLEGEKIDKITGRACNWYFFEKIQKKSLRFEECWDFFPIGWRGLLLFPSPGDSFQSDLKNCNHSLQIFSLAKYKSRKFWLSKTKEISDRLIKIAEKLIPGLESRIVLKEIATPISFEKHSLNYKGAILGKGLSLESKFNFLTMCKSIKGLFICGSWYSYGGISEAAVSGKRAADAITSLKI